MFNNIFRCKAPFRYLALYTFSFLLLTACGGDESSTTVETGKEMGKLLSSGMKMPKQMRHCTPCHTIRKGKKHKIGPNLFGIVDKEVGTSKGYNFSREYKEGKWLWTRGNLDLLINKKYGTLEDAVRKLVGDPKARTRMKFSGAEDADAQIILDYLETLK